MRGFSVATAAALISLAGVTLAEARLANFDAQLRVEIVATVHKPTGCKAKVELHDGAFAGGFITDPACLPQGVSERPIPARSYDFTIPRIR